MSTFWLTRAAGRSLSGGRLQIAWKAALGTRRSRPKGRVSGKIGFVSPQAGQTPVSVVDGWPVCLPGGDVVAVEAGITLGSLGLGEATYEALRDATSVMSVRIDDHPVEDGWKTIAPDGTVIEERTFVVPTSPIVVPATAFSSDRSFAEWTWETHGGHGRLLLWDEPLSWWMVNHPDLETTLICAKTEVLSRLFGDEQLMQARSTSVADWVPLTAEGRAEAAALARRYGLASPVGFA